MKVVGIIAQVLAALAAVIGAIYALATYGEQIVAWAKKVVAALPKCEVVDEAEDAAEEAAEAAAEVVEEVAEVVDEVIDEVVEVVDGAAPADGAVADDSDFVSE